MTTRVGTRKHSNHSTTGSATPTRYDNHSTAALGYQLINMPKTMQSVNNLVSKVYLRAACSLYMANAGLLTFDMPRAFFGVTVGLHDWTLAFVPHDQG